MEHALKKPQEIRESPLLTIEVHEQADGSELFCAEQIKKEVAARIVEDRKRLISMLEQEFESIDHTTVTVGEMYNHLISYIKGRSRNSPFSFIIPDAIRSTPWVHYTGPATRVSYSTGASTAGLEAAAALHAAAERLRQQNEPAQQVEAQNTELQAENEYAEQVEAERQAESGRGNTMDALTTEPGEMIRLDPENPSGFHEYGPEGSAIEPRDVNPPRRAQSLRSAYENLYLEHGWSIPSPGDDL